MNEFNFALSVPTKRSLQLKLTNSLELYSQCDLGPAFQSTEQTGYIVLDQPLCWKFFST